MTKLSELEAILFIVGEEGTTIEELSALLGHTREETAALVAELAASYEANDNTALHLFETEKQIVLTTKKSWRRSSKDMRKGHRILYPRQLLKH